MVVYMRAARDTAHRLSERSVVKRFPVVFQEAIRFKRLGGNNNIGRVPAIEGIGISRRFQRSLIKHRRLYREFIARLGKVRYIFPCLNDFAAEFMPDDDRVFRHIIRHALMVAALKRRLITGHAQAVRYNLCQHFIVRDFRQFKFFQPQIRFSIQPNRFCFHCFPPKTWIFKYSAAPVSGFIQFGRSCASLPARSPHRDRRPKRARRYLPYMRK